MHDFLGEKSREIFGLPEAEFKCSKVSIEIMKNSKNIEKIFENNFLKIVTFRARFRINKNFRGPLISF